MIEATGVTRRFGPLVAVDGVDLVVEPGEVVGFLGPNGAGKSTLLRVLAGYLRPDGGSVRIAGRDPARDPLGARASLGYQPEHDGLDPRARVARHLEFVGRAQGLSGADLADRLAWAIERCELDAVLERAVGDCSRGYRQRVALASAVLHDPPVLLLDEPTSGLDPLQVQAFRRFLAELRPGRAVLLSSHVLGEVEATCDRVLALRGGRLVLDAPLEELRRAAAEAGRAVEAELTARLTDGPAAGEPAP